MRWRARAFGSSGMDDSAEVIGECEWVMRSNGRELVGAAVPWRRVLTTISQLRHAPPPCSCTNCHTYYGEVLQLDELQRSQVRTSLWPPSSWYGLSCQEHSARRFSNLSRGAGDVATDKFGVWDTVSILLPLAPTKNSHSDYLTCSWQNLHTRAELGFWTSLTSR